MIHHWKATQFHKDLQKALDQAEKMARQGYELLQTASKEMEKGQRLVEKSYKAAEKAKQTATKGLSLVRRGQKILARLDAHMQKELADVAHQLIARGKALSDQAGSHATAVTAMIKEGNELISKAAHVARTGRVMSSRAALIAQSINNWLLQCFELLKALNFSIINGRPLPCLLTFPGPHLLHRGALTLLDTKNTPPPIFHASMRSGSTVFFF